MWFRSPSAASFHSPIWRAISRAVAGVSPVTILMPIPASRQRATAAGVRDGGHRREVQPARLDRFEAVVRRGFRPRHGQRAHGAALEPEELFGDLRVLAVRGAHRAHDLRGALHTEDAAARDAAFDDRRHVFAFGREGQPVDDLRFGAQRFVVLASGAHPFEQGPFRGVADDMAFGVEERRGVQGHDLGEFPCGKRVVADQFLHVHAVLGQRAGLVGADDRHGAHRLAGVHFAHEVVGLQHPSHGHRQRQRDRHRKPFGHGHDDDGHRNHEDLQHVLRDGQPVALEQPAKIAFPSITQKISAERRMPSRPIRRERRVS